MIFVCPHCGLVTEVLPSDGQCPHCAATLRHETDVDRPERMEPADEERKHKR